MGDELEIVDKLLFDIKSGKYEPDDKLPSENELAEHYRVPRNTARKAYKMLQELGYIYSCQGKGNYVKDRQQQIPLVLTGNVSFSKKMRECGYDYESKNIFCDEIQYNHKIFQALGAEEHRDKVYKIGRLRLISGRPIALHISYVTSRLFENIESDGKQITSMFDYYRRQGFAEFESTSSVLSVSFPTKYERELLECSGLIPVLVMESGCIDKQTGKKLELTKILYRSDLFTYVI